MTIKHHQTIMTMALKLFSWSYVNFHLCLQDLSHRPPTQHKCLVEIFVYCIVLPCFCWHLTISVTSPRKSTPFENFHCTGRFKRKLPSNHANAGGSSGLLATFQTIFDPIPSASPSAACSCKNSKSLRVEVKAKGGNEQDFLGRPQAFNGESVIFCNDTFKNQRPPPPKQPYLCTLGTSFKERSQVSGNIKSLGPSWIRISAASNRIFNHSSRRILRIMLEIHMESQSTGPKTQLNRFC